MFYVFRPICRFLEGIEHDGSIIAVQCFML